MPTSIFFPRRSGAAVLATLAIAAVGLAIGGVGASAGCGEGDTSDTNSYGAVGPLTGPGGTPIEPAGGLADDAGFTDDAIVVAWLEQGMPLAREAYVGLGEVHASGAQLGGYDGVSAAVILGIVDEATRAAIDGFDHFGPQHARISIEGFTGAVLVSRTFPALEAVSAPADGALTRTGTLTFRGPSQQPVATGDADAALRALASGRLPSGALLPQRLRWIEGESLMRAAQIALREQLSLFLRGEDTLPSVHDARVIGEEASPIQLPAATYQALRFFHPADLRITIVPDEPAWRLTLESTHPDGPSGRLVADQTAGLRLEPAHAPEVAPAPPSAQPR